MAIRFSSRLVIIVLMIFFCFPESRGRSKFGIHHISFFTQQSNDRFGFLFLFFVQIKNLTTVLWSDVRTLSVGLCRIVNLKKKFA